MANKKSVVRCRYPKCCKLHETQEMNKEDAVMWGKGSSYYHPDCLHTMLTVTEIRDMFIKDINPLLTGSQVGALVSTINNIVFEKKVDVDFLKFAIEYFIKYKPGKLHMPFGLHYIIQNREVESAWKKEQERKIRAEMKAELEKQNSDKGEITDLDLPENSFTYKQDRKSRFSSVLGV